MKWLYETFEERRQVFTVIGWVILATIPVYPVLWYGIYYLLGESTGWGATCGVSALLNVGVVTGGGLWFLDEASRR